MSAWSLYDELIDAMPSGITVHDYCLGAHWTYIVADCGMGLIMELARSEPWGCGYQCLLCDPRCH